MLGLLDPDADLTDALLDTGRGVVQLLGWPDRDLADVFAGTAPAPGGPWRTTGWEWTDHGPRLAHATTWATVEVEQDVEVGLVATGDLRAARRRGRRRRRRAARPPPGSLPPSG